MLKDIEKLTKFAIEQFILDGVALNNLILFRVYHALKELIENSDLVANHYLVLRFDEGFLENSSFGSPQNKWRFFLNKDLERLNESAKNYLQLLNALAPIDEMNHGSFLSQKYKSLAYYGFVRDEYSVGYVDAGGFTLRITQLDTKQNDNTSSYLAKHKQIDLAMFEQRVALQEILLKRNEQLRESLTVIQKCLLKYATLEELL